MAIELDRVDRITAGAVGPPGSRVFYLQARKDERLITFLVEKQQVQLLAASVVEILSRLDKDVGEAMPETGMELEEPLLPEWRAGRLAIGYDEERDLLLLELEELVPDEDADDEDEEEDEHDDLAGSAPETETADEPQRARLSATREQMLSLARHGAAVCAAGRPRCQLCGNPMGEDGEHVCPALDGHGGAATT